MEFFKMLLLLFLGEWQEQTQEVGGCNSFFLMKQDIYVPTF